MRPVVSESVGRTSEEGDWGVVSQILKRWEQTGRPDALAAFAEHPELAGHPSVLVDLAHEEFSRRYAAGEDLDADAFAARFPPGAAELIRGLIATQVTFETFAAMPREGSPFSGCELLRRLGRGSFADVFLARQADVGNRLVVLKVSGRGACEGATLGRLSHPNIVPVHTAWVDRRTSLAVVCMPYLGSATLLTVLGHLEASQDARTDGAPQLPRSAALFGAVARAGLRADEPPEKHPLADSRPLLDGLTYVEGVVQLGVQLAEALAHVHDRGICHGDLKPSNVLLAPDGRPMLLDFNLSRDPQANVARMGGTVPYMAPEQLRVYAGWEGEAVAAQEAGTPAGPAAGTRDPFPVDPRSDLFALGVILYQLLAGRHPCGGWDAKLSPAALCRLLLQRQQAGIRTLAKVSPEVPAPLAALVGRCLAVAPEDRPGSAAELAAGLRRCLAPLDEGPASPPPGSQPRRSSRRWWVAASLLLALAAAGGAILAGGAFFDGGPVPRGRDAYRRGDYREALRHFDRAVEANPDRAENLFARGRTRLQLGDARGAQEDFLKAGTLSPDGRTAAALGYHLSRLRQHAAARACYERAIEAGFATAVVYADLGYTTLQSEPDQLEKARGYLTRALELNPDLQAAYHTRALVDLQKACLEPAYLPRAGLEDVAAALALGPETADLHYDAARLYARAAEHTDQAKAADTWPRHALAHLEAAVGLGQSPALLRKDSRFRALKDLPAFGELCRQPVPPTPPVRAVRLLDPLAGSGI
jgi:serine/threonine protein kinase/Flp pilus assembly protein TadD